jgi:hypothetical protein
MFLRLQGCWLDRAGFAIGAEVRVEVVPGWLVLEVIEPELTVLPSAKRNGTRTNEAAAA